MDYMLTRWDRFARFLDDGRICLSNNAAERAIRGIALAENLGCSAAPIAAACGRQRYTRSSAPQSSTMSIRRPGSADVLDRIAGTPQSQLDQLLPWNWIPEQELEQAA